MQQVKGIIVLGVFIFFVFFALNYGPGIVRNFESKLASLETLIGE